MTQKSEQDKIERENLHLLVVDDDDRIRELLKRYLTRQGFRVSAAPDAAGARRLMGGLEFDALILDVMMPGEDGFALTADLRARSDIPIVLLTARGEAEDRIAGLRLGASDYLAKPFEPEELVLRIENLLRPRLSRPNQNTVKFGKYEFDIARQMLSKSGESFRLTTGELGLLTTLARRPGAVVPRYALAESLNAGSDRAVDVQMTRLRKKLEDNPAEPEFLLTVRGQGYRLITDLDG